MANSKSLIAYFSRKGNNYVGGRIVNLPVGNTEVVAKKIQKLT
ncbi:MAG: flavodoxin, partial [Bacteroidota bacterium]|nr:flavodoxin [Bacteroidota bacterium]